MPGGPGRFTPDFTSLMLLWRAHINGDLSVSHTGLSPSMVRLSRLFRYRRFCNPSVLPQPRDESRFGLIRFRSPLLTESMSLSFPPGTKMFQFPGFASKRLYIQRWMTPIDRGRVSAFRNLRIDACLPASRSLSQATTSFVASRCQGIHHTPLVA